MTTAAASHERRISPVFIGLALIMGVSGWAVWDGYSINTGFGVFLFVVSGWVVSLCLHEYAHARTALHGGDISVGAKGYLTLNPLKYTHAALSIVLPVVFVILGGIGLPGGAVFIERGRIRGRWKHSLVSAAGPLTNVLFALLLVVAFALGGPADGLPTPFRSALAFLVLLQISAAILNFLPVPGLDGYGVIEPWLSHGVRRQVEPFAPFGMIAVFGCLYIPTVNAGFWDLIYGIMNTLNVPDYYAANGYAWFQFWHGAPTL
ncbi:site-2 protease family protein [Streptomyces sp. SL13]|uniref:Site-2 protease family protein n=1 Tax=Streptantibioticus silvisoli TaxID=2705255 RepID=A0AA90KEN9_9ACTN|nr:site-2 protease family protein [Streptantibioticus silvisoli]MDI5961639.1 site-2 protease family protein [Streptantibioticus silvisoli]MDI5968220.1 site-2 protease family protein [Streptantibioticus silvisoli]